MGEDRRSRGGCLVDGGPPKETFGRILASILIPLEVPARAQTIHPIPIRVRAPPLHQIGRKNDVSSCLEIVLVDDHCWEQVFHLLAF